MSSTLAGHEADTCPIMTGFPAPFPTPPVVGTPPNVSNRLVATGNCTRNGYTVTEWTISLQKKQQWDI